MKIYVSLGTDCGVAASLRSLDLRYVSLPFDWVVTYNGVSDIIQTNFKNYLPQNSSTDNPVHCCKFVHNRYPDDLIKMERRIERFKELLKNEDDEIIFIRKGHYFHHHKECENLNFTLKNDLIDMEELCKYLKESYPNLNFKIILILGCHECFNISTEYLSRNIKIYNIAKKVDLIKDTDYLYDNAFRELL